MKIRRAIGFAILTYIASMIVGMIISIAVGLDMASMSNPPLWLCIVSVAGSSLLCWLFAWLYFRGKKVKKGTLYGLYFGLYIIFTGIILDIVTWTLMFPGGNSLEGMKQLFQYYAKPYFWATVVLVIIVSILTGGYKAKKHK